MRLFKILFHGLALTAVNVGAVLVGFAFYKMSGISHQLAAQLPAAVLLSVVGFGLWYVPAARFAGDRLRLRGRAAYVGTCVASLAWLPVIFVPLHYATQGYLTSFSNIYYTWLFQAPTNVLALAVAYAAGRVVPRVAGGLDA
ncbi:MAG: hypothetical protein PVH29_00820 [Candidatus Zixiibacteriota bacterium]|jgi:hypothetical protein